MNAYFKKAVICFCIICIFTLSLRPRIAKANPIAIGAVEFVEGSLGGVVSGGAGYAGYDIIERYKKEASDFIIKKSLSTLTNTFFKFYSDSSGQKYVGIDGSGLDELQSMLEDMRHSSYEGIPVFTNKTTSNTTVSSNEPFMLNGFYMKRYSGTSSAVDYDKFSVNYGDSLSIQFYSTNSYSSSVRTKTFLATDDMICRFTASSKGTTFFYYSYDKGTTWYSFNEGVFSRVGDSVFIGYNTVSNSVYVPSSEVITGNGIDGKASDSVGDGIVAVPISGQYDSTTGQKVWAPIDGANIGVKTGLTAIDASKVDAGAGTDTGANTLTQEAVRDAVRDGVNDSTIGDLDLPSSDTPTLDFSPLYIDISKKFPFCVPFDFFNLLAPLKSTPQTPSFHIEFDSNYFYGGGSFDFDFSRFDKLVKVVRYFILLAFIYYFIKKIRAFIGAGGGA